MVATPNDQTTEDTIVASPEEGRALFERQTQRMLGLTADEFLRRWDAGYYRDAEETSEVRAAMHVAMLIPFVRRVP